MLPPPPKNYKISSAFSYNFKLALTRIIRRYTEITELDETILFELVDRIEVGEARKEGNLRICDIKVFYRYVGNVDDALVAERQAV